MRPLGIVPRGRFLFVTTSKTKLAVLLIEVFSKLFNPQNDGHQGIYIQKCGYLYG